MIGILLAMQVNNWNERRLERLEEGDSLLQLVEELETHVSDLEGWILNGKEHVLVIKQIQSVFDGGPMVEPFEFLSKIAAEAKGSFGQPGLPQTTYNELVNSGKFSLIRNKELRHWITDYYKMIVEHRERGNARIGEYGKLSYELVPRNLDNLEEESEEQVQEGLSRDEYADIAATVLNSDLKRHLTSLANRRHLRHVLQIRAQREAEELIAQIESELDL